jgi:hypothetical protein
MLHSFFHGFEWKKKHPFRLVITRLMKRVEKEEGEGKLIFTVTDMCQG